MLERIKQEPVRFWSSLTGIITALFGLLIGFGILDWTQEQTGFVLVLWAAIGSLFQFFYVRNKVTPVTLPDNNTGQ